MLFQKVLGWVSYPYFICALFDCMRLVGARHQRSLFFLSAVLTLIVDAAKDVHGFFEVALLAEALLETFQNSWSLEFIGNYGFL